MRLIFSGYDFFVYYTITRHGLQGVRVNFLALWGKKHSKRGLLFLKPGKNMKKFYFF